MQGSKSSKTKSVKELRGTKVQKGKLESIDGQLGNYKSASGELNKAWTEWKAIFETAKDSIMVIDSHSRITHANRATSYLLGKPLEEIIGKTCWQTVHGTNEPPKECPLKRALSSGKHEEAELFIQEKSIWIEVSADPIIDDEGQTKRAAHIIRDITGRRKAEEALRASEEKYRSIFENIVDVYYRTDLEGNLLLFSPSGLRLLGYDRIDDLKGMNLVKDFYYHMEDRDIFLKELLKHGRVVNYEVTLRRRDGTPVFGETNSHLVYGQSGRAVAVEGIFRDISDRIRTEEALRESESRFKEIFENSLIGMYQTTPDGRILTANPALVRMLGYTSFEELATRNLERYGFESDYPRSQFKWRIEAEGQVIGLKSAWYRRDGTTLYVRESAQAIRDDTGNTLYYQGTVEDITEHKKAEEAIKASEFRFRELFNHMNSGVAVFASRAQGEDFIFTDFNQAGERIDNIKKEDVIGKSIIDVFPGIKEFGLFDVFQKVWKTGEPQRHPISLYKDERLVGWRENYVYKLPSGEVVAVYEDLTDRVMAEKALRESEAQFRRAQEVAHVGSWHLDLRTGQLIWSDETYRIFDVPAGQPLKEADFQALVYLDDLSFVKQSWAAALEGGSYDIEHRIVVAGGVRWVHEKAVLEFDTEGQPLSGIGTVQDITERKRAEAALRESEQKYRELFENAREAIVIIDMDKRITDANKFVEGYGFSKEDLIGRNHLDFVVEKYKEKAIEDFEKLRRGIPQEGEFEVITPKGIITVYYRDNPIIRAGNVIGAQAILMDITERKRAEEELRKYQVKLKAMASKILKTQERERQRLAIRLHDDVCQNLVLTKLALESSIRSISEPKSVPSLKIAAETIGETIRQTESLTFELSDPILREFGFVAAIEKYLVAEIRGKHGIAFELETDEPLDLLQEDIKTCLFRVTRELLINVVKHAHARNVKVSVHKSRGYIHITVQDDGVGFESDEIEEKTSRAVRFGLFSVREQLEHLGGHLVIESKPGRGTVATIVL